VRERGSEREKRKGQGRGVSLTRGGVDGFLQRGGAGEKGKMEEVGQWKSSNGKGKSIETFHRSKGCVHRNAGAKKRLNGKREF